jgi:hypothetical protein
MVSLLFHDGHGGDHFYAWPWQEAASSESRLIDRKGFENRSGLG